MRLPASFLSSLACFGVGIVFWAVGCSSSDGNADVTKTIDGGTGCTSGAECATGLCNETNGQCLPASAGDGKKNGSETDVDCGGPAAAPCGDLEACVAAGDCRSAVCTGNVCQIPTATDGVKNGTETDADCGGSSAPKCADTKGCTKREDCTSDVCVDGKCAAPTDADGVQNGTETDVDCGGVGAKRCDTDGKCNGADDCLGKKCDVGTSKCLAPTYDDGIQNGAETDVDCGGQAGKECAPGLGCAVAGDCRSAACNDKKKCAWAKSCTNPGGAGAYTCGTGGEKSSGAAAWEDCCITRPVTVGATTMNVDKYQVTAGRMRVFMQAINYNVRGFVQGLRGANKIPAAPGNAGKTVLEAIWDPYLPVSFDGNNAAAPAEINDCDQGGTDPNYNICCAWQPPTNGTCPAGMQLDQGNCHAADKTTKACPAGKTTNYNAVYTAASRHLGATIFRNNSQGQTGCDVGAPGTHAYLFTGGQADDNSAPPQQPQSIYDTKSLQCIDYLVAQAFCVWDGGRLETLEEWNAIWGSGAYPWTTAAETRAQVTNVGTNSFNGCRYPTATDANHGDCGIVWANGSNKNVSIALANNNYTYEFPDLDDDHPDYIVFINAPGRTTGRGPAGHADVLGNNFELTSSLVFPSNVAAPTPVQMNVRWSANGSWEGHGPVAPSATNPYTYRMISKYGKMGLRCTKL